MRGRTARLTVPVRIGIDVGVSLLIAHAALKESRAERPIEVKTSFVAREVAASYGVWTRTTVLPDGSLELQGYLTTSCDSAGVKGVLSQLHGFALVAEFAPVTEAGCSRERGMPRAYVAKTDPLPWGTYDLYVVHREEAETGPLHFERRERIHIPSEPRATTVSRSSFHGTR